MGLDFMVADFREASNITLIDRSKKIIYHMGWLFLQAENPAIARDAYELFYMMQEGCRHMMTTSSSIRDYQFYGSALISLPNYQALMDRVFKDKDRSMLDTLHPHPEMIKCLQN